MSGMEYGNTHAGTKLHIRNPEDLNSTLCGQAIRGMERTDSPRYVKRDVSWYANDPRPVCSRCVKRYQKL